MDFDNYKLVVTTRYERNVTCHLYFFLLDEMSQMSHNILYQYQVNEMSVSLDN